MSRRKQPRTRRAAAVAAPAIASPAPGGRIGLDLLAIAALVLVLFFSHLRFAASEMMSPDASNYLDMGRNLFLKRGPITYYNLYQFWPGKQHPFLPYIQPIYAMLAGPIWVLFGLRAVISVNIFLLAVNCGLLYLIVSRLTDRVTAFAACLFVGFNFCMVFSAIFPWTEQLHLTTILIATLMLMNERFPRFAIGALLGLSGLIRVAGAYNVLALFVAVFLVHGLRRRALVEVGMMLAGILAVIVPYELFCWFRYGAFYPEYMAAAKRWTLAGVRGGAIFQNRLPVLAMPGGTGVPIRELLANFLDHAREIALALGPVNALALFAVAALAADRSLRRAPGFATLVCLGLLAVPTYSASFAWMQGIEAERYSVMSVATLIPAGMVVVRVAAARWLKGLETRYRLASSLVFVALLALAIPSYLKLVVHYCDKYPSAMRAYRDARDDIYGWIRGNTAPDALVASEFAQDPCFFDRPFVLVPNGMTLTEPNYDAFLSIYRPDYLMTGNAQVAGYLERVKGFREVRRNDLIFLLKRQIPPQRP